MDDNLTPNTEPTPEIPLVSPEDLTITEYTKALTDEIVTGNKVVDSGTEPVETILQNFLEITKELSDAEIAKFANVTDFRAQQAASKKALDDAAQLGPFSL